MAAAAAQIAPDLTSTPSGKQTFFKMRGFPERGF